MKLDTKAVLAILLAVGTGGSDETLAQNGGAGVAAPPASIPTFPTDNLARKGFLYAGGEYLGEAGREIMGGQMYVEVWVPRRIEQPYPIVSGSTRPESGPISFAWKTWALVAMVT